MTQPHVWLRAESKPFEQRTALTPSGAKTLLEKGFKLTIETSEQSCIDAKDYQALGCEIAPAGAWLQAPKDAYILALKELPDGDYPLHHRHIFFAHAYKEQQGWQQLLGRFTQGGGKIFDLEYLVDDNNRRIAAFGYWAGFAGAALGIKTWVNYQLQQLQQLDQSVPDLADIGSYSDKQLLIDELNQALEHLQQQGISAPTTMVIGALGRSGKGAADCIEQLNLEVVKWDMAETAKGGPFTAINDVDILVNCVFVQQDLPPFTTIDALSSDNRQLRTIVDVSCDPYSSFNPLPIYHSCTTFDQPLLNIEAGKHPLQLMAIDHLPSLLPKESSEDYCNQLVEHLKTLGQQDNKVWQRALDLFEQKSQLAAQ